MKIVQSCECGQRLRVDDSLAGKMVRCPKCGSKVSVRDARSPDHCAPRNGHDGLQNHLDEFESQSDLRLPQSCRSDKQSNRPRQKTSSHDHPNGKPILTWLLILIFSFAFVCSVGIGLGLMGRRFPLNFAKSPPTVDAQPDINVAKQQLVRLDAGAAQADAKKPVEPVASRSCTISGELFVTTKSGDVKRAAGLAVRLIPITADFVTAAKGLLPRFQKLTSESKQFYARLKGQDVSVFSSMSEQWEHEYYEPHLRPLRDEAHRLLSRNALETTTNSDGKFRIELPRTSYLLVTDTFALQFDKVCWCKVIKAASKDLTLSLDHKSGVSGDHVTDTYTSEPSEEYIFESIVRQLASKTD